MNSYLITYVMINVLDVKIIRLILVPAWPGSYFASN